MEQLRSILLDHAERYPLMEPTDAIKLCYQNEFGGGHLVRDEKQFHARLMEEYRTTPQICSAALTEPIGNGLVRVYLNALDASGYAPEHLAAAFLRSAAKTQGNPDSFQKKLELLRDMARRNQLPFSESALEAYLADYEQSGFPMISHSDTYRNAYRPAYRIVRETEL